jgi:hypothetical protein
MPQPVGIVQEGRPDRLAVAEGRPKLERLGRRRRQYDETGASVEFKVSTGRVELT